LKGKERGRKEGRKEEGKKKKRGRMLGTCENKSVRDM
jgi:hypothetical protein